MSKYNRERSRAASLQRNAAMSEERRGRVLEEAALAMKEVNGGLMTASVLVDEVDATLVLERVLRGKTILQIADELNIAPTRATRVYKEALAAVAKQREELGELALQAHLQKVQKVLIAMEADMEKGSPRAAEMYLRALEQEAKLLNLYPAGQRDERGAVNIQVNFNGVDRRDGEEREDGNVVVGRRVS